MRDREFAVAKKALIEGTQDKTTIPESFTLIGNNVLYGNKGKLHTVVIGVPVPSVKLDYGRIELRGDGKLLEPPREFELNSWVRNFYNWVVSNGCLTNGDGGGTFDDGYLNSKNTAAAVTSAALPIAHLYNQVLEGGTFGYWQPVGTDTAGIVLGTDDTPVDEDDYDIGAAIGHGLGAGELYYATSQNPAPDVWDDPYHIHSFSRYFDNFEAGEGSITVEEMGLISNMRHSGTKLLLVARDIISPALVIPFRAQAKITYNFSLEFGSTSPLRNFYNFLTSSYMSVNAQDSGTFGAGYINGKDTSNNIVHNNYPFTALDSGSLHINNSGYFRNATYADSGLVVGSDDTEVSFNDYILGSQIANGAGAGQLGYSVSEAPVKSWADPVFTVSHGRTFSNTSGSNVTVQECGAIARVYIGAATAPYLFHRHVIDDVVIGNGESLRVVYQFRVTYP